MNKQQVIGRECFVTEGQYNKFKRVKSLFEKLIELHKKGYMFLIDDEIWKNPFIDGTELGFDKCLIFVGCTTDCETGKVWVDASVTELKKRIIPLKRMRL